MPVEERLREVLHDAVPRDNLGVTFDEVAGRVRRRRRAFARAVSIATVALIASAIVVSTQLGHSTTKRRSSAPSPRPTPSGFPLDSSRPVAYRGIVFTLPPGWLTAQPLCGVPPTHTLVISHESASNLYCPYESTPKSQPTFVELSTLYGRRFALSWPGHRTAVEGQPAWQTTNRHHGLTQTTLTLPWLDVAITTASPDPARAAALLKRVSIQPLAGLAVPSSTASIFVQSLDGTEGDGVQRSARITNPSDVDRLLSDLRSLPPLAAGQPACNRSWYPHTVLLTMRAATGPARTYAARFDSCTQVVAGTGHAARVSDQLLSDIKRLVPNSGL